MAYIDGFVLAVPSARKDAYHKLATDAAVVFRRHGAIGFVENWGLEVPQGKVNCFNSAVMRKPDETVMFSWIVWPGRGGGPAPLMSRPRRSWRRCLSSMARRQWWMPGATTCRRAR